MAITRWEPLGTLSRWDPFREMATLRREMDDLFGRMAPLGNGEHLETPLVPTVEMEDMTDAISLKLEIPGMEAKDLDIQVTDTSVSVSGERKSESKTEEKGMVRSEFRYGKFERVIPLPAHIQNDKVKAEYQNGVLQMTLPKAEGEKRKVVQVKLDQ
jgi:HSP20 family protein